MSSENGENVREEELRYLYEIANILPGFLEERGFTAEPARGVQESTSPLLSREAKPYYRDYICNNSEDDYQSLHITFYDNSSRSYMEVQLRTKEMDDVAEIGSANHLSYEKNRKVNAGEGTRFPRGNVSILTRPMSGVCGFLGWILLRWTLICLVR